MSSVEILSSKLKKTIMEAGVDTIEWWLRFKARVSWAAVIMNRVAAANRS